MTFWFTLKEGLKGFKRARLATSISIVSVAFALLLLGLFMVFTANVDRLIGDLRSRIELEVFLEPVIEQSVGMKIASEIALMEGVSDTRFISKADAANRFEKQFGRNIYEVLDTNPLPPSVIIHINEGYRKAASVREIAGRIAAIDGVDEVAYQEDLLQVIDKYIHIVYLISGAFGGILLVIAFILLHNTIRLTILARKDIIQIMKLVGAKEAFIRRPFIVEGLLQGLIGGIIANALLWMAVALSRHYFFEAVVFPYIFFAVLVIVGVLIGIISSKMSVSKYLKAVL
ncbi:MAG: FtsX-like permease family protein [Caldithrix sp.]|nr:FtsX-like permease family protein [Caldithrix sp.]